MIDLGYGDRLIAADEIGRLRQALSGLVRYLESYSSMNYEEVWPCAHFPASVVLAERPAGRLRGARAPTGRVRTTKKRTSCYALPAPS
jgi:hypothetical protein